VDNTCTGFLHTYNFTRLTTTICQKHFFPQPFVRNIFFLILFDPSISFFAVVVVGQTFFKMLIEYFPVLLQTNKDLIIWQNLELLIKVCYSWLISNKIKTNVCSMCNPCQSFRLILECVPGDCQLSKIISSLKAYYKHLHNKAH